MAYLEQNRPSPTGLLAAIGVQGAIVTAMIVGLTVSGTILPTPEDIDTWDIKVLPEPTPEPDPAPSSSETVREIPDVYVPDPPVDLGLDPADYKTSEKPVFEFPDLGPVKGNPGLGGEGTVKEPVLSFDPVAAKPRNDPMAWITVNDYRSSWIRREMVGTARFRLEIAANGTVTSCTVTNSTGHSALDTATCKLVSQRAKFQPARDTSGEAVAGSYSSAVRWQLPE